MNIMKLFLKLAVLVAVFVGSWALLCQVNWVNVLHIESHYSHLEEKLGEMIWDIYEKQYDEIKDDSMAIAMHTMVEEITTPNKIDLKTIKIHLVNNSEINAFALPNRHLVVYTGLINSCHSEEELIGVLGHELGHIEKKHVMKKVLKEFGISMISTVVGGKGGGKTVQSIINLFSSSAYDRLLEKEADITSVEYMIKAHISPEPFSNFLLRMSQKENSTANLSWISTHPDSKVRSEYILNYCKNTRTKYKKLPEYRLENLQKRLAE